MADAVSVIIPTFRREAMLLETLASVQAQTGIEFEVLVADDTPEASARAVVEELRDPRVRFLHLQSAGGFVSKVRNAAALQARYPLAMFLDDDDLLEPEALSRLARALRRTPKAALAFGRIVPLARTRSGSTMSGNGLNARRRERVELPDLAPSRPRCYLETRYWLPRS